MVSLLTWSPLSRHVLQGDWTGRLRRACGWIFFLAMVLTAGATWAEPKLEVSLDRDTISMGDSAVLSLTFEDCTPPGQPELPTVAGLQYGGVSSRESYTIINGAVSGKMVYSIEVRPTQPGTYTIPALEVTVNGVLLQSRPVTLKVVNSNVPLPNGQPQTAFVRIVPASTNIYLGQTLPVEVQCYCQDNVGRIQMPQFSSDNFIVGDLPNPHERPARENMGNVAYNLFDFKTSVTAIKTGKFNLGPATWTLTVYSGQRTFFGWTESHEATFTSDTPEINVLPVPTAGAPPGFSGAIGRFTLAQYEAGPTTVNVGDPITLKIRIAGSGAFGTVSLPTNNDAAWREFKTYPPTSKVDTTDPMQIAGSKYFEQVITPLNAEVRAIPPFVFSYFDPNQNGFRTLTHDAIPLDVHATAAAPQPTVISAGTTSENQEGEDIVHIKPMPGKLGTIGLPLFQRPGFLALQAVPPLAWVCALVRRKQKEKLANNPRLRRQRHVAGLVRQGLADLARQAAANDAEKFHATALHLLQEQLGERLDLPAPAITEAVLDDLPQKGLRPETPALLRELFHACNQYRYTPEHASRELASLIPKVKTVLQDLRAMPAAPAGAGFAQGASLLLLFFLGAMTLCAAPVEDTFRQANKFYEEGKYGQAAAAYEQITQAGAVSPALYFNLGNACLKAGQFGRAICAYRQAEALAPRDPDVRANLQIARTQSNAGNPALPGDRWTRWIGRLTLNEWTAAASVAIAAFFLVLTAREIWPEMKRSGAAAVGGLGLAGVVLAVCLGLAVDQRLIDKSCVIVVPEAVARRGPLTESQSAFTVHDGAELLVLGRDGDWLQVTDAANHVGWLARNQAAVIP